MGSVDDPVNSDSGVGVAAILTDLNKSQRSVEVSARSIGVHAYIVIAGRLGCRRCKPHAEKASTDANRPHHARMRGMYPDVMNR